MKIDSTIIKIGGGGGTSWFFEHVMTSLTHSTISDTYHLFFDNRNHTH
jgi:hypothetical protein